MKFCVRLDKESKEIEGRNTILSFRLTIVLTKGLQTWVIKNSVKFCHKTQNRYKFSQLILQSSRKNQSYENHKKEEGMFVDSSSSLVIENRPAKCDRNMRKIAAKRCLSEKEKTL